MRLRFLVVDDYESWRRFAIRTLQRVTGSGLISEASDGANGLRLAQQLQPDLIVLDIGLPQMSGIEVARQVRRVCPSSKILFMSENRLPDIAVEALRTGAGGYVVKSNAASELWPAIKTVLEGKRFISPGLMGPGWTSLNDHRHEVAIYPDDISLVGGYARFIEDALSAGNTVIVVVTESHRARLIPKLQADGVDVGAAIEQGRYVPFDANDAMSTLVVNDTPDPDRCAKFVGDVAMRAAKRRQREDARVMVCGEIAPTMLSNGKVKAAVQLEHLWDEITRGYGFHTLCGYLSSALPRDDSAFESICAEHSVVHGLQLTA